MGPLTTLPERKALMKELIQKVPIATISTSTNRKGGRMWDTYFREHPEDAEKMGYGNPDQKIWDTNAQLYRSMTNHRKKPKPQVLKAPALNGTDNAAMTKLRAQVEDLEKQNLKLRLAQKELGDYKEICLELLLQLKHSKE
jgi:hypothetical protein